MTFIIILGVMIVAFCGVSIYLMLRPAVDLTKQHEKAQLKAQKKAEKLAKKIAPVVTETPSEAIQSTKQTFEDPDVVLGLKATRKIEPKISPKIESKIESKSESKPEVLAEKTINKPAAKKEASQIIVLHLLCKENSPYNGYELLQALLACGLRYGEMQIFHRHLEKNGLGDILFSLACMEKPGTFDLAKMGGFSCTGLTLFLQVDQVEDPVTAYELMIETAGQLVDDLGGEVLDEKRQLLNKETVYAMHKKLREQMNAERSLDLFV